jgi:hypothetical protein
MLTFVRALDAIVILLYCAIWLAMGAFLLTQSRPVDAQSRPLAWSKQSDTTALQRCLDRGGVPVVPFGSDDQAGVFACVARVK